MTMDTTWRILEGRGLDVERLANKGWAASTGRDGGSELSIAFVADEKAAGKKLRAFGNPDRKWLAEWVDGPVAYNGDCLKDDSLLDHPLIITEGEIDCESAIEAGYQRVISVPNGCAGTGKDRSDEELAEAKAYDWLRKLKPYLTPERVKEVILAVDGDEAGAKLLHEVSLQLGRFRCKFLNYPKTRRTDLQRERCKDLNEVLIEYGPKGVVETINRASWVAVKGVSLMSALPPLPEAPVYEIGFESLGKNYKMRLGDFVVVTGVPGFGKSTFLNDVCCRVATNHGLTIAWASFEQAPQRDHRRALRSWHAEMPVKDMTEADIRRADDWIDQRHVFIVPDEEEDATLEWLLDCMEVAVVRHGAKVIVIDPWNELEHVRDGRESETEYTGRAIRVLKRFAKKFQCHLILVAHPAKLQKVNGKYLCPSLYDISGSANFYNKCDLGIIVHREDADHTIIKVQKSRYHDTIGRPGEMKLAFRTDDRRLVEVERLA